MMVWGVPILGPGVAGKSAARGGAPPDPPTWWFLDSRSDEERARDVAEYTNAYNAEMLYQIAQAAKK